MKRRITAIRTKKEKEEEKKKVPALIILRSKSYLAAALGKQTLGSAQFAMWRRHIDTQFV
jgi:hypothetical protein